MMDDSDSMVECPYNLSHRVQKSRMQTHLVKCRKRYLKMELRRCPFNANHDLPPHLMEKHIDVCPDRGTVQHHLVQTTKEKTPVIMPYVAPILPPEDENWDCDGPVETYDPTAKNINVKVLRGIQGASKSERKSHRAQERLRFTAVTENGGCEGAVGGQDAEASAGSAHEGSARDKQAYDYQTPIRRPTTASNTFAIPEAVGIAPAQPAASVWGTSAYDNSSSNAMNGDDDDFVPPPAVDRSYETVMRVEMGEGVPVPNLDRNEYPELSRGRGRGRHHY